jgi:hypothetical protein
MNNVRVEIFGKTFDFRNQIKSMGLKRNPDTKHWTGEIDTARIDEIKKFISDKHEDQVLNLGNGKYPKTNLRVGNLCATKFQLLHQHG